VIEFVCLAASWMTGLRVGDVVSLRCSHRTLEDAAAGRMEGASGRHSLLRRRELCAGH